MSAPPSSHHAHRPRYGGIHGAFLPCAAAITVIGIMVRYSFLDYPFRYDEAWHYFYSSVKSPLYIVTHFNHVLHSLLVRCTISLFGTSPAALRLPAFAAGIALIPLTGWLAWSLSRSRAAVLLAMLAACGSSQLIEYSVNSRGYSGLAVFTTLAAICSIHLLARPDRRRLWVAWGLLGALGAYTHAIMLLPMLSLGAALCIAALRAPRGGERRRRLIRGIVLGSTVCGVVTALLFLPIVATRGEVATNLSEFGKCKRVYTDYLGEHGQMFLATWRVWIRHTNVVWQAVILIGFAACWVDAIRKPAPRYLVPLTMLVILPIAVWAAGIPVVPPGWILALPMLLACSMHGVCVLSRGIGRNQKLALGWTVIAIAVVSATASVANVSKQTYLSTWDHELVDVESIVEELEAYGTRRCALVSRFNPATRYYRFRHGVARPLSPTHPDVERVFIVVGTLDTLEGLWNESVEGFSRFGPPRKWREYSRSTLYVADRI